MVKQFNGEPHILMVHAAGNWRNKKFGFPKGMVEKGEDLSAAAIRETREETGIVPLILDYLSSVKKKKKEVHAYIATYESGALKGKEAVDYQRSEVDVAKFYPLDQAINMSYDYQKPLFEKAQKYIEENL